jgi:hypothetical protein
VQYSLVQGGWVGEGVGNLGANPLFVAAPDPVAAPSIEGDVRLLAASPAIDAGNSSLVPEGVQADLAGNGRFVGRVDMGAYEYGSVPMTPEPTVATPTPRPTFTPTPRPTFTPTATPTLTPSPAVTAEPMPSEIVVPSAIPLPILPQRTSDGLEALYTFQTGQGVVVYDRAGTDTPLHLGIADPSHARWIPGGGLALTHETIVQSFAPATRLVKAVRASNELTLEAWVRPASTGQNGPARIVTLSEDVHRRNVTLAQGLWDDGDSEFYNVRLRTSETDSNGRPSLSSLEGSLDTELTHLVYTRDDLGLGTLYINGVRHAIGTTEGDLSATWNAAYHFALGNEVGDLPDRAWIGEYYLVAAYSQALTWEQVIQNLTAGPGNRAAGSVPNPLERKERTHEGVQALYTFNEGAGTTVYDQAGTSKPLDLEIADPLHTRWIAGGGLLLERETVVQSTRPARRLSDAIRSANEVTVEAWVRPASLNQDGPARIVTLSEDAYHRNVTLAQGLWDDGGTRLYDVRLRTSETSTDGQPSLSSPDGSLTTDMTHVVYTRDATGRAFLYINGVPRATMMMAGDLLTAWDKSYYLALGNEVLPGSDRDRFWLGEYALVALYDRALSAQEVTQNFAAEFDTLPRTCTACRLPTVEVYPYPAPANR